MRAALLRHLHGGRAVGVLHDHVGTLVEQCLGGVGLLTGIEPRIHPDDLDLDVRVDRLRTEHGGVDTRHDFRDRERADIAEHARLRRLGGDLSLDVAALIEARRISRDVLVTLVASVVLEEDVGIFLRHLDGRIHVAERGGEDQLVSGARKLLDRAFRIGPLVDVLEIGGLDLVPEVLHQRLPPELMLVGPSEVADRPEIDEADLQLPLSGRVEDTCSGRDHGRCRCHQELSHLQLRVPFDGSFRLSLGGGARHACRRDIIGPARRPDRATRARPTRR